MNALGTEYFVLESTASSTISESSSRVSMTVRDKAARPARLADRPNPVYASGEPA